MPSAMALLHRDLMMSSVQISSCGNIRLMIRVSPSRKVAAMAARIKKELGGCHVDSRGFVRSFHAPLPTDRGCAMVREAGPCTGNVAQVALPKVL